MLQTTPDIRMFDPKTATNAEFAIVNRYMNKIRAEAWPDDPPKTLEETIGELRSIPPFVDVTIWQTWNKNEIIASGNVAVLRTEDNKHLVQFDIHVLPPMRRQGIAKRLLTLVAEVTQTENRRLLVTQTNATVPAGEAFMKRLGARVGMTSSTNQLILADLNPDLIRQWQAHAPKGEFELGLWNGAYPEKDIEAIVKMHDVMNTAPRDDLEIEDLHFTAEHIRQQEASLAQRKVERWTLYVREKKTDKIAGYTEVFWNPAQPETLQQGDTGVFPQYRNHGLGRWLKASMLSKLLKDRPQAKRVRTGNANSNAPMLKINYELGFKPYKSWTAWQVELEKVLQYLKTAH